MLRAKTVLVQHGRGQKSKLKALPRKAGDVFPERIIFEKSGNNSGCAVPPDQWFV
jgi:hypothetical protein